jgi:pimeloyl-ACP methyl ester carboxylesterase
MPAEADFERMVDIGGCRLCLCCAGQGTPAVVIDAGLGEGLKEWKAVLAAVSAFTRVCAYDRAGVGKSDRGPKPPTSQQKVIELRALLTRAGVVGPYVLVGHSIGGLHMQLYAASYPAEIAGLVVVDASFPDMKVRLAPVLGTLRSALLWRLQAALAGEGVTQQDWNNSFTQVAVAGQLPDVPLVVISAGQPAPMPPPLGVLFSPTKTMRVMQAGHAVIAKASAKGRHIIYESSNHNTMRLNQDLVTAIAQVVAAARDHKDTS